VVTDCVGYLEGFFECQACDDCPTSIISMANVEDRYRVMYIQGESITVHMDDRDEVFMWRDKMYVADFSDWLACEDNGVQELYSGLNLLTVQDKESMYTHREVRKALEAGEFLKALGYPSEQDALEILRSVNVSNIPHSPDDVRRFYAIYGPQVAAVRGKTTKSHPKIRMVGDEGAKLQITNQDLVAVVMHVARERFLISISAPLGLLLVCHLQSLTTHELGQGLQKHLNTLRSRGFDAKKVSVDPYKSFEGLQGVFPGVAIDLSGAGDHLDKVYTKIRWLKETMRSIVSALPYKLAKERVKDLVTYAVGRMNLHSTDMLVSTECPRVRFTGKTPDYASELGLAFGDYVEAYNPNAHAKSNDIFTPKTEPCITLYPVMNTNGSWVMLNLNTKAYVRRLQWRKCNTPLSVINRLNEMAGITGVVEADRIGGDDMEEEEQLPIHRRLVRDPSRWKGTICLCSDVRKLAGP
jgi:hypothetical protein